MNDVLARAAGVGFLGAGAILKGESTSDVRGLATAAVGLAAFWMAAAATALTWLILKGQRILPRSA